MQWHRVLGGRSDCFRVSFLVPFTLLAQQRLDLRTEQTLDRAEAFWAITRLSRPRCECQPSIAQQSSFFLTARNISYAFDVDPTTQAFTNRRVFAYVDTGIADGIQLDTQGNVYSGTGEGVQVRCS